MSKKVWGLGEGPSLLGRRIGVCVWRGGERGWGVWRAPWLQALPCAEKTRQRKQDIKLWYNRQPTRMFNWGRIRVFLSGPSGLRDHQRGCMSQESDSLVRHGSELLRMQLHSWALLPQSPPSPPPVGERFGGDTVGGGSAPASQRVEEACACEQE